MTADELRKDERELRLPKWAQQEFDNLRRHLREAKNRLAANPEDSNTFADDYTTRTPLGRNKRITFYLGEETDGYRNRIDVQIEDGKLYVHGGDGSLRIMPRVSNAIYVDIEDKAVR